ncbi:hypothetical protein [Xanthobacter sp. KR7-225]|uniref:hypothetical protein n=1 Tax=Xanthobacter sp. KR7-225 TaxID=3156613 RepID=UPI0032B32C9D
MKELAARNLSPGRPAHRKRRSRATSLAIGPAQINSEILQKKFRKMKKAICKGRGTVSRCKAQMVKTPIDAEPQRPPRRCCVESRQMGRAFAQPPGMAASDGRQPEGRNRCRTFSKAEE